MDTSLRFRSLAKWVYWIAVVVSGFAGIKIVLMLSYQILMAVPVLSEHWALSLVALKMIAAVLTFLVLILAFNVVAAVATKNEIKIDAQSIVRGAIYSALLPFILGILGFLIMLLLAGSGMHDSM